MGKCNNQVRIKGVLLRTHYQFYMAFLCSSLSTTYSVAIRIRITKRTEHQSVSASCIVAFKAKSTNILLCTMLNKTVKGIGVDKIARNIHKQIVFILGVCVVFFASIDQSGVLHVKKKVKQFVRAYPFCILYVWILRMPHN